MDGGFEGNPEHENFNAASAKTAIPGRNVHPGYAKDKMINAIQVACELNALLPPGATQHTRSTTALPLYRPQRYGHQAQISYIVRDHDSARFEARKNYMQECVDLLVRKYGEGVLTLTLKDSYYNMRKMKSNRIAGDRRYDRGHDETGRTAQVHPRRTDGGTALHGTSSSHQHLHRRHEFPRPLRILLADDHVPVLMQVILNLAQLWTKIKYYNNKRFRQADTKPNQVRIMPSEKNAKNKPEFFRHRTVRRCSIRFGTENEENKPAKNRMNRFGFLKVAMAVPHVRIADCDYNAQHITRIDPQGLTGEQASSLFPNPIACAAVSTGL